MKLTSALNSISRFSMCAAKDTNRHRSFQICLIVAMDQGRVIGFNNQLPWHLPDDMKRFSRLTSGNTVLMGRKTYQSLPERFRPLPNRKNIVITRSPDTFECAESVSVFNSPDAAIEFFEKHPDQLLGQILWVIGGGEIYQQMLPMVDQVYVTEVVGKHEGDVFFPIFEDQFELLEQEPHEGYCYRRFIRGV